MSLHVSLRLLYLLMFPHVSSCLSIPLQVPSCIFVRTRPVVGGHLGINMHISEMISDILDPVVSTYDGGKEIISTEDMVARLEILNDGNKGWSPTSYWGGMITDEFRACGTCEGTDDYEWDGNIPEVCKCDDGIDGDGRIMVTATCMKMVRRDLWEKSNDWGEGELDRILL